MTGSDTPLSSHVVTPSPPAQPSPVEQTLSFPGEPCTAPVFPTTHPCSISVDEESMSQNILSVETVPGSNILNITNIEIAQPANAEMSQPQPSTSATSSPPPSSSIKDYFLQHIMPTKKSNVAKRQRHNTLKYGESLTSEEALLRLEESERKKASKKKQSKDGKTKGKKALQEAVSKEANETCATTFTVERDVYYAVMSTKPAAYYIA